MNTRLRSLKVFRGATVALMILVNNPGSWNALDPPLADAPWLGCMATRLPTVAMTAKRWGCSAVCPAALTCRDDLPSAAELKAIVRAVAARMDEGATAPHDYKAATARKPARLTRAARQRG